MVKLAKEELNPNGSSAVEPPGANLIRGISGPRGGFLGDDSRVHGWGNVEICDPRGYTVAAAGRAFTPRAVRPPKQSPSQPDGGRGRAIGSASSSLGALHHVRDSGVQCIQPDSH